MPSPIAVSHAATVWGCAGQHPPLAPLAGSAEAVEQGVASRQRDVLVGVAVENQQPARDRGQPGGVGGEPRGERLDRRGIGGDERALGIANWSPKQC